MHTDKLDELAILDLKKSVFIRVHLWLISFLQTCADLK